MAGQREEDVVERRAAEPDVVDRDPGVVEIADDLDEALGAGPRGRGDAARVVVDGGLALAVARDDRDGLRDHRPVADDDLDPLAADLRLERVGGPAGDDLAAVDHGDAVGELVGLLQVLRGQQDRRPFLDALADHLPHAEPAARIEAGRRLVEEDQPGAADQRAGEVESPPHPAGVRLERAVGRIGERELLEQFVGAPLRLGFRELVEPAEQHEILATGQVLVDRRVLPREADHRAQLLRFGDDVVARDRRASRIGLEQRRQDPDRRRLARAVRPEQSEHAALGDGEIQAVERPHLLLPRPVDLDETFGGDCVVASHPRPFTMSEPAF